MKRITSFLLAAVIAASCTNPFGIISGGKALVYKATDPSNDTSTEARIITPGQGTSLFLRPVKR